MFWKRLKKDKAKKEVIGPQNVEVRLRNYPSEVILTLAEGVTGNEKAMKLLTKAGYEELNVLVFALKLKNDARDWLMKNGFPHLMAYVNAIEGKEDALKWLKSNKLDLLFFSAMAGDGKVEGYLWLEKEDKKDWFLLSRRIQDLKDDIEERHNDVHNMGE